MEYKNITERIAAIIEDKKITPNAFANQLGIKSAIVYNLLKERNKPGYDLLLKICEKFNVNGNWLLTGEDKMYNETITFDETHYNKSLNPSSKFLINMQIITEAEFLNIAQERTKKINHLYNQLINIRALLFQELNVKTGFATQAESDLLNSLARPSINSVNDESIFSYPYENLNKDGKTLYLNKTEECITLFTNTFFEYFRQFYKEMIIPYDAVSRRNFLAERAKITDQWKYTHLQK